MDCLPFHLRKHLTRSRTIADDEEKLLHLNDFLFYLLLITTIKRAKKTIYMQQD